MCDRRADGVRYRRHNRRNNGPFKASDIDTVIIEQLAKLDALLRRSVVQLGMDTHDGADFTVIDGTKYRAAVADINSQNHGNLPIFLVCEREMGCRAGEVEGPEGIAVFEAPLDDLLDGFNAERFDIMLQDNSRPAFR